VREILWEECEGAGRTALLHTTGIDDRNGRPEPGKAGEMPHVKRQDSRYPVDVANRQQSGIMYLFADHAERHDQSLPLREDVW